MNVVILLAGGVGTRMNSKVPKQHIVVNGHQIIEYTLKAFSNCEDIDLIVVVSNKDFIGEVEELKKSFPKLKYVCHGGETRMLSVMNGIKIINNFISDNDKIIISDAARPCISRFEIKTIVEKLNTYNAVTSALECYETILKTNETELVDIIPRDNLVRQASPEGYIFKSLKQLYLDVPRSTIMGYKNVGIDQLFALGESIGIVFTNPFNFKITTQKDLEFFEIIARTVFDQIIN